MSRRCRSKPLRAARATLANLSRRDLSLLLLHRMWDWVRLLRYSFTTEGTGFEVLSRALNTCAVLVAVPIILTLGKPFKSVPGSALRGISAGWAWTNRGPVYHELQC